MTKKQTNVFKGVAIILMFVHHLFGDAGVLKDMNVHPFVPQNILLMIASAGKVCVAIFVFASAYGITKQQEKSGDSNLAGRIIKIWMPFFFIYIFAAIAAVVTGNWKATYGKAWQSNLYFAVIDALGLANLFGTPTLNGTWWYMSLALILPFIIYAAIKIYDKFGAIGTIVLGIFIPGCLGVTDTDSYRWWMLTVVLGVLLAKTKFFEKLSKKTMPKKTVLYCIMLALIPPVIYIRYGVGGYWLLDTVLTFCIAFLTLLLCRIPGLRTILRILGEHSYYMFLTHSFIFYYYCRAFTYRWKYPALILLVLVITDFVLSAVLDGLYRLLQCKKIENYLVKKIEKICKEGEKA